MSVVNSPGLSQLRYRVGTYSKFRASMIASLQEFPSLLRLTTRADNDLAISIIDAWATVADILTFYQERIANEGFLNTATERRSVLELARSIGYELRPGVAASTYLAFTLDDSPGGVSKSTIQAGIKVQSLPLQGSTPPEIPQIFETIPDQDGTESFDAYPEFNNLQPMALKPQFTAETSLDVIFGKNKSDGSQLFSPLKSLTFEGTDTRLRAGDCLLITKVSSSSNEPVPIAFKRIATDPVIDRSREVTTVNLVQESGKFDDPVTPAITSLSQVTGYYAADLKNIVQVDASSIKAIMSKELSALQLSAVLGERGWHAREFANIVNSVSSSIKSAGGIFKVFALRIRAGLFGSNAQAWNTIPSELRNIPVSPTVKAPFSIPWEDAYINTTSQRGLYGNGTTIYLENSYDDIIASNPDDLTSKSWVVVKSKDRTAAYSITDVNQESIADFMMSAKVTSLDLAVDPIDPGVLGPYLVVSPSSGRKGTLITVTGGQFPENTQVKITSDTPTHAIEATVSVGINGLLSPLTFVIPDAPAGEYTITAADTDPSNTDAVASCSIKILANHTPSIELDPIIGLKGQKVKLLQSSPGGFVPGTKIEITFNSNLIQNSSIFANANGSIPDGATFEVPSGSLGRITVTMSDGTNVATSDFYVMHQLFPFKLRQTTVYTQSEELPLAYIQDSTPLEGNNITLDKFVEGLNVGQAVAISGKISKEAPNQIEDQTQTQEAPKNNGLSSTSATEVVFISGIKPFELDQRQNPALLPATSIQISPSLVNTYDRSSVTINANVALATHGETKNEVLGSGNPSQTHLEFVLKQKPLTYVAASTPSGISSTLEVRVDDILWREVPSLYRVNENDKSYLTRIEDGGQTRVIFGRARPPNGIENIKARYRVGIGSDGMLEADQLSQLMTRPLGVRSVTNPTDTSGAADPENIFTARQNCPLRVLTMDRIVSLVDVENFALGFAGIGKAAAEPLWEGERRVVRLIIAGALGETIDTTSYLFRSLLAAIDKYKDFEMQVKIESFKRKFFEMRGRLIVAKEMDPNLVKKAAVQALYNAFSFEARGFGQPVDRYELIKVIQEVDGVTAADVDYLYLSSSSNNIVATKDAQMISTLDISELLVLNPDSKAVSLEVTLG